MTNCHAETLRTVLEAVRLYHDELNDAGLLHEASLLARCRESLKAEIAACERRAEGLVPVGDYKEYVVGLVEQIRRSAEKVAGPATAEAIAADLASLTEFEEPESDAEEASLGSELESALKLLVLVLEEKQTNEVIRAVRVVIPALRSLQMHRLKKHTKLPK